MFPGDFHDSAARLAATVAPQERDAAAARAPSEAWRQMLALGWQAVLVPEALGGADGSLADMASIVEASARHALHAPLIDRCAVATNLLAAAAARADARSCLEAVVAGEASVCPVLEAAPRGVSVDAAGVLHGTLRGADLSEPASHLLVEGHAADGSAIVLLLPTSNLGRAMRYVGVDGSITADIALDGLRCTPEAVVLRGAAATAAVARARLLGAVLGCVQTIAAAGAMIEHTIAYLNTRMQFGVALATFQALRHRVVDMYVAYENGRGLVRQLVLSAGAGDASEAQARDVAMARLYVDDVGRLVAESAIQLHGGMGMSRETLAARIAVQTLVGGLRYGDRAQCLDFLVAHAV